MSLQATKVNRLRHCLQKNNFYRGTIVSEYDSKLVEYGNKVDLWVYREKQFTHANPYVQTGEKKMKKERADSSLIRARQMIYWIVTANIGAHGNYKPVFLTLTYAINKTNLQGCNRDFKYFIQKLSAYLGYKIRYTAVPEFQIRGAVHYHVILYNLPFTPFGVIESMWGHGHTGVELMREVKDPAAYVSKYLKKGNKDKRLYGQRVYMCSRGLVRPKMSTNDVYNRQVYDTIEITEKRASVQYTLIKGALK